MPAWLGGRSAGVVSGRWQQQSSCGRCAGMVVFCSPVLLGLELSVRWFFPVAAADLQHSDVLRVAVPSVALSKMKKSAAFEGSLQVPGSLIRPVTCWFTQLTLTPALLSVCYLCSFIRINTFIFAIIEKCHKKFMSLIVLQDTLSPLSSVI